MRQPTSGPYPDNWYERYCFWVNQCLSHLAHILAQGLYTVAKILGGKFGNRLIDVVHVFDYFSQIIVEPQNVYMHYSRNITLKGIFLMLFDGLIIGYWLSIAPATFPFLGFFFWIIALLLGLSFILLFMMLFASGDIYFEKQDELQRALSHEAASSTIGIAILLLIIFLLIDKSTSFWQHAIVYQGLAVTLILFIRAFYMARLTYLRWRDLAALDGGWEDPIIEEGA